MLFFGEKWQGCRKVKGWDDGCIFAMSSGTRPVKEDYLSTIKQRGNGYESIVVEKNEEKTREVGQEDVEKAD